MPLMECVSAIDNGIVHAIKNSSVIRWLLTYNTTLRPEDLKKNAREFAVQFLENSDTMGVAAVDTKARAEQISQKEYIPPSSSVKLITERIYSIFNTNAAIVNSDWSENQWNAYYESNIEPALLKFANAGCTFANIRLMFWNIILWSMKKEIFQFLQKSKRWAKQKQMTEKSIAQKG